MTAQLEVWIANPTDLCRVDNGNWRMTILDSTLNVLEWRGHRYEDEAAISGHWGPGPLPPGYYVVKASRPDGKQTAPALIQICCDGTECLHLFSVPSGRGGKLGTPSRGGKKPERDEEKKSSEEEEKDTTKNDEIR